MSSSNKFPISVSDLTLKNVQFFSMLCVSEEVNWYSVIALIALKTLRKSTDVANLILNQSNVKMDGKIFPRWAATFRACFFHKTLIDTFKCEELYGCIPGIYFKFLDHNTIKLIKSFKRLKRYALQQSSARGMSINGGCTSQMLRGPYAHVMLLKR